MLDLYQCVLIHHLHVELPPKLPWIPFSISPVGSIVEQLFYGAVYGDPVASSGLAAVISSQVIGTPHSIWVSLGCWIDLLDWLVWVCLV